MEKSTKRNNISKGKLLMGRHLAYSEGTVTEPKYIECFSKRTKKPSDNLNVLIPVNFRTTKHTMGLVERAIKDVAKRRKKGETIDGVWLFLDKDSFDDFENACEIIYKMNNTLNDSGEKSDSCGTVWHCCWSNQCFEIWVYFHYEELDTQISRHTYIERINSFIKNRGFKGKYKKNMDDLYGFLETHGGDMSKAIKLSKAKLSKNKPFNNDPSTGVYEFFEYFKSYFL